MSAPEFWELTPRETLATIEAFQWRQEQAHRRDAWLAWHVAALSRAKRLPGLRALLRPAKARGLEGEELERRRRERDEMLARVDVERLNEAMRRRNK